MKNSIQAMQFGFCCMKGTCRKLYIASLGILNISFINDGFSSLLVLYIKGSYSKIHVEEGSYGEKGA